MVGRLSTVLILLAGWYEDQTGFSRSSRGSYVRKGGGSTPTFDDVSPFENPILATVIGVPTLYPTSAPGKTFSVAVTSLNFGPPFSGTVE